MKHSELPIQVKNIIDPAITKVLSNGGDIDLLLNSINTLLNFNFQYSEEIKDHKDILEKIRSTSTGDISEEINYVANAYSISHLQAKELIAPCISDSTNEKMDSIDNRYKK